MAAAAWRLRHGGCGMAAAAWRLRHGGCGMAAAAWRLRHPFRCVPAMKLPAEGLRNDFLATNGGGPRGGGGERSPRARAARFG
eukprot:gene5221-10044_t